MSAYSVDDGNGNQITAGLQPHLARKVAQQLANERGESVWLYDPTTATEDSAAESEEFKPDVHIE